jgi:hypothetical protein
MYYILGTIAYFGEWLSKPIYWFIDNAQFYDERCWGRCRHGYWIERRVIKRPFRQRQFIDKGGCPKHVPGDTLYL